MIVSGDRSPLGAPIGARTPAVSVELVEVHDPRELDSTSRLSHRMPEDMRAHRYQLRDRSLLSAPRFSDPITRIATCRLGDMYLCRIDDRFETQIDIAGDGLNRYCLSIPLSGTMELVQNGTSTRAAAAGGLVLRGSAGTRLVTSDACARANLWIEGPTLEHTLEEAIDDRLSGTITFANRIDWTTGLAASLRGQVGFLLSEVERPDGLAGNPVALASFTDLVLTMLLRGLPHNYSDALSGRAGGAIPGHIRRADDFMRAHAGKPLRMREIAAAAGCGVRTLSEAYRQFRDTTPLAALYGIRLDRARAALRREGNGETIADIGRRHGFTNATRFKSAYQGRFNETPAETIGRGSRAAHGVSGKD